jgi:hypothetical protein
VKKNTEPKKGSAAELKKVRTNIRAGKAEEERKR